MNVLITGANGQLGTALQKTAPSAVKLVALDRAAFDLADPAAIIAGVRAASPELIINAAAYTAVDAAESDEAAAFAINATAVERLGFAAAIVGARLIHVSTDFVFDGTASTPYSTDAEPAPISAYGRTKRAGELTLGSDALIVRTAWVYSATGSNFAKTMLALMMDRPELRIVDDQIGTPTHALALAAALWKLADQRASGIFHYTDSGVASWYDFAVGIQEEALALGLLRFAIPILPISTRDFPRPARRPSYAVLDKSATWTALGAPAPHWRTNLRNMLETLHV